MDIVNHVETRFDQHEFVVHATGDRLVIAVNRHGVSPVSITLPPEREPGCFAPAQVIPVEPLAHGVQDR